MVWPYLLCFNSNLNDSRAHLSLHHALQLFQLIRLYLYCFVYCFLFCAYFCLCDHVDNVPFEGNQEQVLDEEINNLARKASGLPPLHVLFYHNNSMSIHFTLLLHCINFMGILLRTLPSHFTQALEH